MIDITSVELQAILLDTLQHQGFDINKAIFPCRDSTVVEFHGTQKWRIAFTYLPLRQRMAASYAIVVGDQTFVRTNQCKGQPYELKDFFRKENWGSDARKMCEHAEGASFEDLSSIPWNLGIKDTNNLDHNFFNFTGCIDWHRET